MTFIITNDLEARPLDAFTVDQALDMRGNSFDTLEHAEEVANGMRAAFREIVASAINRRIEQKNDPV